MRTKLTSKQVHKICELIEKGEMKTSAICKEVGCNNYDIYNIKRGVNHKNISVEYDI